MRNKFCRDTKGMAGWPSAEGSNQPAQHFKVKMTQQAKAREDGARE
jgi:hypothetical protein